MASVGCSSSVGVGFEFGFDFEVVGSGGGLFVRVLVLVLVGCECACLNSWISGSHSGGIAVASIHVASPSPCCTLYSVRLCLRRVPRILIVASVDGWFSSSWLGGGGVG